MQMPTWITVLQGLLTPTIALIAVGIGFMQWRTAHQKVMLDLFDRRMIVVNDYERYFSLIVKAGIGIDPSELKGIHNTRSHASFLFGSDVNDFLNRFYERQFGMAVAASMMKDASEEERRKHIEVANERLSSILGSNREFYTLVSPYLNMDQKRVRTPKEWFHDANAKRLSYSDKS